MWSKFMLLCATPVVVNTGLTRAFERSRHFIEIRSLKKKWFPKPDLDPWIPSKYKKLGSKAEVGFMILRATSNLRFFRDIGAGGVDSLPFLLSRAPGSWSPVQWRVSVFLSAFVPPICAVWAQDITKAWGRTISQRSGSQLALTIYIGDIQFSHNWSRKDDLLVFGNCLLNIVSFEHKAQPNWEGLSNHNKNLYRSCSIFLLSHFGRLKIKRSF